MDAVAGHPAWDNTVSMCVGESVRVRHGDPTQDGQLQLFTTEPYDGLWVPVAEAQPRLPLPWFPQRFVPRIPAVRRLCSEGPARVVAVNEVPSRAVPNGNSLGYPRARLAGPSRPVLLAPRVHEAVADAAAPPVARRYVLPPVVSDPAATVVAPLWYDYGEEGAGELGYDPLRGGCGTGRRFCCRPCRHSTRIAYC